jgi:hypothetical protein
MPFGDSTTVMFPTIGPIGGLAMSGRISDRDSLVRRDSNSCVGVGLLIVGSKEKAAAGGISGGFGSLCHIEG